MYKTGSNGIAIINHFYNSNGPQKISLNKSNSVLIFPFDLTMGYITSTENGIRENDSVQVKDYSNFERIFTGLENIIAQWDNAYNVYKKNDNDLFLTKEFQVGRSLRGRIVSEEETTEFTPSTISDEFLAEYTGEKFTITMYEDIKQEDRFKLFIIPEKDEKKWLYISSAKRYWTKANKFHHIEIEMQTLNNKIAKSGKAIEEFVHRSAPGDGYAFPKVNENQEVLLDTIRNRDIPITAMQVEGAGALAMGTMYAYGRPTIQETKDGITKTKFNPKIEAPRLLLPYKMETPKPSAVNTKPTSETDWLIGRFKPTLDEDFADWKEAFQAKWDLTQRAKYEGTLKSILTNKTVQSTNPLNQGTRNNLMWDANWVFKVNKTYKTDTDPYTGSTLKLNKEMTLPELLCHNIFGLSAFNALPLSVSQNISWSLKSFPIINGFLSKMTFGIPLGWTDTAIKVKMDDIVLAIPASLVDYANVLMKQSDKIRIDLNTFTDEQAKNDAIEFSGIKATGSLFKVSFTDRFTKEYNNVEYTFNTNDLSQKHPTKDEKGISLPATLILPKKLEWDNTCKPAPRGVDTPGYVIDSSAYKAIAKMNVRTTFFSNDFQAWTGTHLSTGKFTGSIRDWNNAFKYSNWKEKNNKQIDYPAAIVSPNPPSVNNPKIDMNWNKVLINNNYDLNIENRNIQKTLVPIFYKFTLLDTPNKKLADSITFDTTPYGGITNIKNNYEKIALTLKDNQEPLNFEINIKDLISSGSRIVNQKTLGIYAKIKYPSSGSHTETLKRYFYAKLEFEIAINGNEIRLNLYNITSFGIKQTIGIPGPIDNITPEKWPFGYFSVDKAILYPKKINKK